MSHFTVLVIGENIEQQLAPYHAFECTGRDDQYVQDIDITDEVREEFTAERQQEYGSLAEFAEAWYGTPILSVDNPLSEKHKYGYVRVVNGQIDKIIRRTNPNKKWDWYEVGGRWTGFFKAKPGAEGLTGEPGVLTEPAGEGRFDCMRKCDIDFDGMRAEAAERAGEEWDRVHAAVGEHGLPPLWSEFRKGYETLDGAREAYAALPATRALREAHIFLLFEDPAERYGVPREEFCQRARDSALATFAVLKDGEWHERGEIVGFGISKDDVSPEEWHRKFSEMLDALPDETVLTIVDCHI